MTSKRGRKRNDNLPPNRARDVQRAFRARRAAHLQALEERVGELEEENDRLRAMLNLPPANRPPLGKGPTGKDKLRSYPSRANTPLLSEYHTRDASPSTARTGSSTPSSVIHQTDGITSHSHPTDNGVQGPHWDTAIVLPGDGDAPVHPASYVPPSQTYPGRYEHDGSPSSPTNARTSFSTNSYVSHTPSHHFSSTERPISSVTSWSGGSFHRDEHFPYSANSSTSLSMASDHQIRLTVPHTSVNNAHALDGSVSGHDLPHQHNLGYGMRRSITDPSYPAVDHSPHVSYSMQTPSPLRVPHTSRPPPNRLSHSPDYGP